MHITVSLTVAESKRLIAKGVARDERVIRARNDGMLAVASGTTDGYVIEEITGESFDKTRYVTGHTLPAGYRGPRVSYNAPDLVIRRGERLSVGVKEAVADMGPGDVFVKGANALNYDLGQAGVLIGDSTGGTVGATLGTLVARRVHLLQPVGLEKSIPGDLHEAAAMMKEREGRGPTLWVTPGEIFTEIEAFNVVCGVLAVPVGAGGIGGAEGAVWLALYGDKDGLGRAEELVDSVRGEPPFLPVAG
ncbi:MAG: hypothetical protein GXP31_16790 [Kiritimatiellaeota bacterium]|nr:hypothetical protein [Kiritimatiellota bacterium]